LHAGCDHEQLPDIAGQLVATIAPCTVGAHAAAKLPTSIAATADRKRAIAAMSSARGKAIA